MDVTPATAALYLPPGESAAAWLLRRGDPAVTALLRAAADRTPDDPCDPDAVHADLDDLRVLIEQRHFAVAEGHIAAPGLGELLADWRRHLQTTRPRTWGAALGVFPHHLRWLLRDNHFGVAAEDRDAAAAVHPRRYDTEYEFDPHPLVERRVLGDVLYLHVKSLAGQDRGEEAALNAWAAGHPADFAFAKIVLDLRGNGGGNDRFALDWIEDHARHAIPARPQPGWRIGGEWALMWNTVARLEAVDGPASVATWLRDRCPEPGPDTPLTVEDEGRPFPAGPDPWTGAMLVVTDAGTASSAETAALAMREALGAVIVGADTAGYVTVGNLTPYLLGNSGMAVSAGSFYDRSARGFELLGIPPDVPLDPRTPAAELAERFDELHARGAAR